MIRSGPKAHSEGLKAICRAQQADTPEQAIRGACLYLLKAHGIEEPPIPLKPLLRALDISFSWSQSHGHWRPGIGAASLQSINGQLAIYIHEKRARSNWRRTRFTIAHEITHGLLLRMLGDHNLIASLDKTEQALSELERICNVGAAELLMPTPMMRQSIRQGLSPQGMLALYDRYLVSRASLVWRVASLIPFASVTRWRKFARNPTEPNCFRVLGCYPPYDRDSIRPWLPKGATTKHLSSSMVQRTAQKEEPEWTNELSIELSGKTWECEAMTTFFPERKGMSNQPHFEGFTVPDETGGSSSREILLFAVDKKAGDSLVLKNAHLPPQTTPAQ